MSVRQQRGQLRFAAHPVVRQRQQEHEPGSGEASGYTAESYGNFLVGRDRRGRGGGISDDLRVSLLKVQRLARLGELVQKRAIDRELGGMVALELGLSHFPFGLFDRSRLQLPQFGAHGSDARFSQLRTVRLVDPQPLHFRCDHRFEPCDLGFDVLELGSRAFRCAILTLAQFDDLAAHLFDQRRIEQPCRRHRTTFVDDRVQGGQFRLDLGLLGARLAQPARKVPDLLFDTRLVGKAVGEVAVAVVDDRALRGFQPPSNVLQAGIQTVSQPA